MASKTNTSTKTLPTSTKKKYVSITYLPIECAGVDEINYLEFEGSNWNKMGISTGIKSIRPKKVKDSNLSKIDNVIDEKGDGMKSSQINIDESVIQAGTKGTGRQLSEKTVDAVKALISFASQDCNTIDSQVDVESTFKTLQLTRDIEKSTDMSNTPVEKTTQNMNQVSEAPSKDDNSSDVDVISVQDSNKFAVGELKTRKRRGRPPADKTNKKQKIDNEVSVNKEKVKSKQTISKEKSKTEVKSGSSTKGKNKHEVQIHLPPNKKSKTGPKINSPTKENSKTELKISSTTKEKSKSELKISSPTQEKNKTKVKISSPKSIQEVTIGTPLSLSLSSAGSYSEKVSEIEISNSENNCSDNEAVNDFRNRSVSSKKDGMVRLETSKLSDDKHWISRHGKFTDKGFLGKVTSTEQVIISPPESLAYISSKGKAFISSQVKKGIHDMMSRGCKNIHIQFNGHDNLFKVHNKSKPFKLLPIRSPVEKMRSLTKSCTDGGQEKQTVEPMNATEAGTENQDVPPLAASIGILGSQSKDKQKLKDKRKETEDKRNEVKDSSKLPKVSSRSSRNTNSRKDADSNSNKTIKSLTKAKKEKQSVSETIVDVENTTLALGATSSPVSTKSSTVSTKSSTDRKFNEENQVIVTERKSINKKSVATSSKHDDKKKNDNMTNLDNSSKSNISQPPREISDETITSNVQPKSSSSASEMNENNHAATVSSSCSINEWSTEDVHHWLTDNELAHVTQYFQSVDGPGIIELVTSFKQQSSLIMQYFNEMGVSFQDNLKLCSLLRKLSSTLPNST